MKYYLCQKRAESQCPDCGHWTCWEDRRDFPPNFDDHVCYPCVGKRNDAMVAHWRDMYAQGETLNEMQLPYNNGFTSAVRAEHTSGTVRICLCPPKAKHDGNLDKDGKVRVWFDDDVPFEDGCVHLGNEWSGGMSLFASEALSLLDWLQQNKRALERLRDRTDA